jgi:predicted glycosyltransferase
MRILVDMGHPGHVHFFRNALRELESRGHEIMICARDKDVTLGLLNHYEFPHKTLSKIGHGTLGLSREFIRREWKLMRLIRSFDPHIVTAIGGLFIAPVARLMNKPSIVFTDTESVPLDTYLTYPFATVIATPDCFLKDLKGRHLRYAGLHELAYLHPNHFIPDPNVLKEFGITEKEPFFLLRFVAWQATHDIGQHGFSLAFKKKLVEKLAAHGRVFISAEGHLPKAFESYRLRLAPQKIHHALHYAALVIGEGATIASEAGILGTPSIYTSSLALNLGYISELMNRYKLVLSYQDQEPALRSALELIKDGTAKDKWKQRRKKLFAEKIDVTAYVVDLLENHAEIIRQWRQS